MPVYFFHRKKSNVQDIQILEEKIKSITNGISSAQHAIQEGGGGLVFLCSKESKAFVVDYRIEVVGTPSLVREIEKILDPLVDTFLR